MTPNICEACGRTIAQIPPPRTYGALCAYCYDDAEREHAEHRAERVRAYYADAVAAVFAPIMTPAERDARRAAEHAERVYKIAAGLHDAARAAVAAAAERERLDAARAERARAYHTAAVAVLDMTRAGAYERDTVGAYHDARAAYDDAERADRAAVIAYAGARAAERPDTDA